jgi:hypothetical protein
MLRVWAERWGFDMSAFGLKTGTKRDRRPELVISQSFFLCNSEKMSAVVNGASVQYDRYSPADLTGLVELPLSDEGRPRRHRTGRMYSTVVEVVNTILTGPP